MFFDASDMGVGTDLDAFHIIDSISILMSFDKPVSIPGLGQIDDFDIVRFTATSSGNSTAGSFSLYFDGSDVGLDSTQEDIDALTVLSDGRIIISTSGSFSLPGVSGKDEDLLAFTPNTLGAATSGSWEMYFDGSDVELSAPGEDVGAIHIASNGDIYLSTRGNFTVSGVSGADEDVFICRPVSLGNDTGCTFLSGLFFDGSAWGLDNQEIDALGVE